MASIVLGAAGAALGAGLPVVGPIVGGVLGRAVGGMVGGWIDDAVFGGPGYAREGARLGDLSVQVSTYGKTVSAVYGMVRLAGNILWSRPIKETAATSTSSSGGGKGGGGGRVTSTTYSYSVTLAIGICEGPIDGVVRAWADAKQLDLSQGTYRIYKGTETQLPDTLIESFEGAGRTPAYRGMAYVVIEDFPLADYGNRIPNFTFEVKRRMILPDYQGETAEEMVRSMIMIPGAGEFVYDTAEQTLVPGEAAGSGWAQSGLARPVNRHTPEGKANALVSLDQLQETCPNVDWVSVVVCWFGDSMDAAACTVQPGVEFASGARTQPDGWSVAGRTRTTARLITQIDGKPVYGGTPDDESLLRYLDALKARGLKVMLLPMFFMDVPDKPWRGRVTGSAAAVDSFFTKANGYNAFIMHYANLAAGRVDAFAIGSELVGLTKVASAPGTYPAVNRLVALAASVRAVLGSGVKLTYAADWSEYHHAEGGWYNLDPLWASPNIDMVGIDAYFPLTDALQTGYDIPAVIAGWDSGEGYDWYYSDPERTVQVPLSPAYAWKNLAWWWENPHVNPNAAVTGWVPQSKPVWFTEYGFPSVDGATNQPNVFYDPTSAESFFPRHSRGQPDVRAQRLGIVATEARWKDSPMVERRFLWTWDARPYPYFPDLREVWADGGVWLTGHWVTGKLGLSSLGAIVRALCLKAGLPDARFDVTQLTQRVEGYVITRQASARQLIEELMSAYFFDAVESDGVLVFKPRGGASVAQIEAQELATAADGADLLSLTRQQELELPRDVNVLYLSRTAQYQMGTQSAHRRATVSRDVDSISLPLVMSDPEAAQVAQAHLYLRWMERLRVRFHLDNRHAALEPADIVTVTGAQAVHTLRITRTLQDGGCIRVDAVAEEASLYRPAAPAGNAPGQGGAVPPLAVTELALLDLPALPGDGPQEAYLRYAMAGRSAGWGGGVLYRSEDGGANYEQIGSHDGAVIGMATTALAAPLPGVGNRFDEASSVEVRLIGDEALQSVTALAVLNGAGAALLGDEVIQFREAVELAAGKYRLSGLLRGRLGTEWAASGHQAGERFVLLDGRLRRLAMQPDLVGLPRLYKAVSVGGTLGSASETGFTYEGRALKPLAPAHVTGERDGSGNLTVRWVRRARTGHAWRDLVDVPLDEAAEAYRVDIMDGADIRGTILCSAPELLYSVSDQAVDFGVPQSAVSLRIRQVSAVAGGGYATLALL